MRQNLPGLKAIRIFQAFRDFLMHPSKRSVLSLINVPNKVTKGKHPMRQNFPVNPKPLWQNLPGLKVIRIFRAFRVLRLVHNIPQPKSPYIK